MDNSELQKRLKAAPIVPLIQADRPDVAVRTAEALVAGGLSVLEVVLRSDRAMECAAAIVAEVPAAITGTGTVLSADQAERSLEVGMQFLVSPGLYSPVVDVAQRAKVEILPGVATASEAQLGWNLGLRTMKFFPAGQAGGVPMLQALASVFRDVRFMPTGGISPDNLADYLALDAVIACGGSWLTPSGAIADGNYQAITQLAQQACEIAANVRA